MPDPIATSPTPRLDLMLALARAAPAEELHVADLPYRLSSWALDGPANVGLWLDADGRLQAWAIMQTPFWTIDLVCHPRADERLRREVLAWADGRARDLLESPFGRPAWYVNVFARQTERRHDLEAAGFVSQAGAGEDAWSKVLMERPARLPVAETSLPPGFAVRPLAGESEAEAYVALHRAAFGSENMTVAWRRRTLRRPEYLPDLDLLVVAPDGRPAAFCVCWFDPDLGGAPVGQIEPLGVHPDFRGLGLGRAVLAEGLRRLHARGAARILVETDNYRDAALGLYEATGFQVIEDVPVYRKDYA